MDRSSFDLGAVTHQATAVQTSILPMWECLLSLEQAGKEVKHVLTERTLFLLHGADRNTYQHVLVHHTVMNGLL